jgi:superfamily II DNA/RNA helicase
VVVLGDDITTVPEEGSGNSGDRLRARALSQRHVYVPSRWRENETKEREGEREKKEGQKEKREKEKREKEKREKEKREKEKREKEKREKEKREKEKREKEEEKRRRKDWIAMTETEQRDRFHLYRCIPVFLPKLLSFTPEAHLTYAPIRAVPYASCPIPHTPRHRNQDGTWQKARASMSVICNL